MAKQHKPLLNRLSIAVDCVALDLAVMERAGTGTPILCLHGLGSTKEDYGDIAFRPGFADQRLIAYDAPGCGKTVCGDLTAISIPFLVETARAVVDRYDLDRFHLVGHSMGGLPQSVCRCSITLHHGFAVPMGGLDRVF